MLFAVFTDNKDVARMNEKDLRRWAESFSNKEFSLLEAIDYLETVKEYKIEQVY